MVKFSVLFYVKMLILPVLLEASILKVFQVTPPLPKHRYSPQFLQDMNAAEKIAKWKPEDGTNVWEQSGLLEGDIMIYPSLNKNGLLDAAMYWPNATVPYYIDDDFTNEEAAIILGAMQEYHNKTCMRFRPYRQDDKNWIDIRSDSNGCWSSVGMKPDGQIVNLSKPKCVRHGVVVHELMHAIGFYHQHSASDRDEFVKIVWDNIADGRERNFNKYNEDTVSQFNVTYDYSSVMHYSSKAFSRNGENTIEPLTNDSSVLKLGQRVGMSESDIKKVNFMYQDMCNTDIVNIAEQYPEQRPTDHLLNILDLVGQAFGFADEKH